MALVAQQVSTLDSRLAVAPRLFDSNFPQHELELIFSGSLSRYSEAFHLMHRDL